jgi:hypothetical protein
MFADRLPAGANIASPRVAAGLGVVPRLGANDREIYRHKLSFAEVEARLAGYYRPYHTTLNALCNEAVAKVRRLPHPRLPFDAVARHGWPCRRQCIVPGDPMARSICAGRLLRGLLRAGGECGGRCLFARGRRQHAPQFSPIQAAM